MTLLDETSFAAGQETGTRRSAAVARLAANRLVEGARWWNGRRLRLMAGALEACADELEACADALGAADEQGAADGVVEGGLGPVSATPA